MNLGVICNHSHIVYHAMVFTNSITSEDKITVIVKKLIMTGATQQDYTRSVANLARQVTNRLRCTNVALADKLTHFLSKTAVALFLAYWKVCLKKTIRWNWLKSGVSNRIATAERSQDILRVQQRLRLTRQYFAHLLGIYSLPGCLTLKSMNVV